MADIVPQFAPELSDMLLADVRLYGWRAMETFRVSEVSPVCVCGDEGRDELMGVCVLFVVLFRRCIGAGSTFAIWA